MSTSRTHAVRYQSDQDCYGQTCWLVRARHMEEIEKELNAANDLARRLYDELCTFDCDDTGQDLKEEARAHLGLPE